MSSPYIKKKISSFLLEEEGKISKKSVITMGSILVGLGILAASDIGASHLCTPPPSSNGGSNCSSGGGGNGCGGNGCGGTSSAGSSGSCDDQHACSWG